MARGKPFEKGSDARRNAGGRPKELAEVVALARAQTGASIRTLAEIRDARDAPAAARVTAAEVLLKRGWGNPVQPLDGDGEGGPIKTVVTWEGET